MPAEPKTLRFLLLIILTLSLFSSRQVLSSDSVFSSTIFSFDDLENATGCHVSLTGETKEGFK